MEQSLTPGCLPRRDFLAYAPALGLVAATPSVLASDVSWAATPKKGDQLRIGVAGGAMADSPATMTDTMAMHLSSGQLRHTMVEAGAKRSAVPELAGS